MATNEQISFANASFEHYAKTTRRAVFLDELDSIMLWKELCAVIAPFYSKGESGRPPIALERMLRIHFIQQWFNLSDPAAEEALYDSFSMRAFVGIDLGNAAVPDETTICRFRHLLEKHNLGKRLFEAVNVYLHENGVKIATGTIVDATIISALSSTKNKAKARDPEMHQTKKGNNWHFGMKAHIGIDSRSKLIHTLVTTPANVHDSKVLPDLLHGKETRVWGDAAYVRQREPSARRRRMRVRSSTSVRIGIARLRMLTKRRTNTNRAYVHTSSIASASSRACGVFAKCAIVGWQKKHEPTQRPVCSCESVHAKEQVVGLFNGIGVGQNAELGTFTTAEMTEPLERAASGQRYRHQRIKADSTACEFQSCLNKLCRLRLLAGAKKWAGNHDQPENANDDRCHDVSGRIYELHGSTQRNRSHE
jgi:IS5 family transposase